MFKIMTIRYRFCVFRHTLWRDYCDI